MRGGKTDDSLLQVDDDEGGDWIQFRDGHDYSFRVVVL
jgi:hypothetical protein